MATLHVYTHKLAVGEIALAPGNSALLYTSPPGQVTVLRDIQLDTLLGSIGDAAQLVLIDFATGQSQCLINTEDVPGPPQVRQWTGRLAMLVNDIIVLNNTGTGTGGSSKAWITGYILTLP